MRTGDAAPGSGIRWPSASKSTNGWVTGPIYYCVVRSTYYVSVLVRSTYFVLAVEEKEETRTRMRHYVLRMTSVSGHNLKNMLASPAVIISSENKLRITEQKHNLPRRSKYLYKYSVLRTMYGVRSTENLLLVRLAGRRVLRTASITLLPRNLQVRSFYEYGY